MQIVETLLEATGMRPSEMRWRTVDSEYPPLPFMYHRSESDFDVLLRVLASQGIFFYFEHSTALPASMSGDAGASAGVGASVGGIGVSVSATGALTLAGKTATMETAGAQIALGSSSASVTAAQVKIGPGSGALSRATVAPEKVTSVQMKDSTGKPRANARVLLTQGGKQRMTVLNANGMLELIGDSQYQISFPDDPVTK